MKPIILAIALQGLLSLVSSHIIPLQQVSFKLSDFPELARKLTGPSDQLPVSGTHDSTRQVDLCKCGQSSSNRIIGGTNANEGEIPWRAFLLTGTVSNGFISGSSCGGTIISPRWILTAAHCLADAKSTDKVYVGVGSVKNELSLVAKQYFIHENYQRPDPLENDIGLVELSEDLDFGNRSIGPACLPYQLKNQTERLATVLASGWGTTREGDSTSTSDTLLKVTLDVIGNKRCQELHTDRSPNFLAWRHWGLSLRFQKELIKSTQICTLTPRKDTCQGDSGGSIDEQIAEKYYAVGVVSYGHGCARENEAGIYTRVSEYTSWIENRTRIQSFCKQ